MAKMLCAKHEPKLRPDTRKIWAGVEEGRNRKRKMERFTTVV